MSSMPEPAPAPRAELPAAPDHGLGVALNGDGADFAVHAPHATAVDLCLLTTDADGAVVDETRIGMHGPQRGVWSAHVPGIGAGQRYDSVRVPFELARVYQGLKAAAPGTVQM